VLFCTFTENVLTVPEPIDHHILKTTVLRNFDDVMFVSPENVLKKCGKPSQNRLLAAFSFPSSYLSHKVSLIGIKNPVL